MTGTGTGIIEGVWKMVWQGRVMQVAKEYTELLEFKRHERLQLLRLRRITSLVTVSIFRLLLDILRSRIAASRQLQVLQ